MFRKLSTKILSLFIAVTVLVIVITSTVFVFLSTRYITKDKESVMITSAETLADFISEQGFLEKDSVSVKDLPNYTNLVTGVAKSCIWICKDDGLFLLIQTPAWPASLADLSAEQQDIIASTKKSGRSRISNDFSSCFSEQTVTAVVPIYSSSNESRTIVGVLILHSPMTDVYSQIYSYLLFMILSIIFAVIVSAFLASTLTMKITKPVKDVCVAASEMANGNYDINIKTNEKGEMNDLAFAMNDLAKTLKGTISRLKSERDKSENIINNISDGLALYDENMRLQKYNMALMKICNQNQLDRAEVREMIGGVLSSGEMNTCILNEKDILRFTATCIENNGNREGVVVIVQDISQQERLEQLRNEFVANVSHEFRTPLTIIKGSVEALMDGAVDEEDIMKYLTRIDTESIALEHLVKDLLDTSRFKSGRIVLDIQKVNTGDLIDDLVSKLQPVAMEKNIKLSFIKGDVPDIPADFDRFRQMIIILIDNAIKFTPNGGRITVQSEVSDGYAHFSVQDTGVGIPEDELPYVFERFYKVDKARGGSETGTGLGLSIASKIATLHGGTIEVTSELGKGTKFTIITPLDDSQE